MRLKVGEIRMVVVGIIYLVSTLFSKFVLGGYENETIFIVSAFLIVYLIFESWGKGKRKQRKKGNKNR